jgi:predicted secreted protein
MLGCTTGSRQRSISAIHDRLSMAERRQCGRTIRVTRWCRTVPWTSTSLRNIVFEWVNKCSARHIKSRRAVNIENSKSVKTVIKSVIKYSRSLTKTGSPCYRSQWEIRPCYRSQWEIRPCYRSQWEIRPCYRSQWEIRLYYRRQWESFDCDIASSGSVILKAVANGESMCCYLSFLCNCWQILQRLRREYWWTLVATERRVQL